MRNHFYRQARLPVQLLACLLALGALSSASARAATVTVTVQSVVKSADLDLNRAADVHELYRRLSYAAEYVCGSRVRVGLEPVPDSQQCYEKVLGKAVRSINRPSLRLEYLATHSLQDAERHGIARLGRLADAH
jgi:UrcA family protein